MATPLRRGKGVRTRLHQMAKAYPLAMKIVLLWVFGATLGTLGGNVAGFIPPAFSIEAAATRAGDSEGANPFVLFVPGLTPAKITYGPLLEVLGDDIQASLKELEVFAGDLPPSDYGFHREVEGIKRVADAAGQESIHLVGYSAGGSAVLAFAARYPARVKSLALIEPAWIGNEGWTPEEVAYWANADAIMAMPMSERMGRFLRFLLRPGVEPPPPPPGARPPWMIRQPAALEAIHWAFKAYKLEPDSLRTFRKPVYFALGSHSNPAWERMAERLTRVLPTMKVEVYEGRHHLNSPHTAEPERFARALRELWARAEAEPLPTDANGARR